MNRERLTILRDHLASLPDERVNMVALMLDEQGRSQAYQKEPRALLAHCGTAACIAGWANALFGNRRIKQGAEDAEIYLGLTEEQSVALFEPEGFDIPDEYSRSDAIAAIQSMLDSPDDDALPVWPEAQS